MQLALLKESRAFIFVYILLLTPHMLQKLHYTQMHFFKLWSSIINQFHSKLNHVSSHTAQCKSSTKTWWGPVQRKQDDPRDSFFPLKNATVLELPVSRDFTPTAAPALQPGALQALPQSCCSRLPDQGMYWHLLQLHSHNSRLPSKGNQADLEV